MLIDLNLKFFVFRKMVVDDLMLCGSGTLSVGFSVFRCKFCFITCITFLIVYLLFDLIFHKSCVCRVCSVPRTDDR